MRNLRDARSAGPVGSWRCEESVCVSQVGRGWRWRLDVKWDRRVSMEGVVGGMIVG